MFFSPVGVAPPSSRKQSFYIVVGARSQVTVVGSVHLQQCSLSLQVPVGFTQMLLKVRVCYVYEGWALPLP